MKIRGLYLSATGLGRARDRPATLYAMSAAESAEPVVEIAQPSLPGRGRPRAEGARVAGAARPESFDADLPVMDSSISDHSKRTDLPRRQLYRLAETDTLEHAATLLWDVTGVDPFAEDNCPRVG
jgi:citrate synthase